MKRDKMKRALALSYNETKQVAPQLSAKGKGLIAENIIKKAEENDVPIVEDPSLVELLSELNINETIPEQLYEAVAEVFAYIYQVEKEVSERENL